MNKQELNILVDSDKHIILKQFTFFENSKDDIHVIRKQQQRAISNNMILIALNYGVKNRSFQDITYTITDRCLINTKYEKHLSKLRGLTIVGNWDKTQVDNNSFIIITCFWNYKVKSRKRY